MEEVVICVTTVILLLGGNEAHLRGGRLKVKFKPEN